MNKKSLLFSLAFSAAYLIFTQISMAAGTGGTGGDGTGGSDAPSQICDLIGIIAKMIRIIAPAAGIGFFLMLIYAGYMYLFSFGDPGKAGKGRSAMLTALIGVVVLLLVYGIFKSLELVTGLNLLNFSPAGTQCN